MERKELLMVALIGLLLITTAMQTVAILGMGSGQAVGTGTSTATNITPSSNVPTTTGSASTTNLENLPSMEGGC